MAKSEFHRLRDKYPDIFSDTSRLPGYVRLMVLFVQQELEQEEGGTDVKLTDEGGDKNV